VKKTSNFGLKKGEKIDFWDNFDQKASKIKGKVKNRGKNRVKNIDFIEKHG
jgi:hypothetical protein